MLVDQLQTVPNLGAFGSSLPRQGLSIPVANYHGSFKFIFKLTPHFLKKKKKKGAKFPSNSMVTV